jgi:hypothetical protein
MPRRLSIYPLIRVEEQLPRVYSRRLGSGCIADSGLSIEPVLRRPGIRVVKLTFSVLG